MLVSLREYDMHNVDTKHLSMIVVIEPWLELVDGPCLLMKPVYNDHPCQHAKCFLTSRYCLARAAFKANSTAKYYDITCLYRPPFLLLRVVFSDRFNCSQMCLCGSDYSVESSH